MTPEPASADVANHATLRTLGCALLLVLLGFSTYAGRLDGPFVFDDEQSIVHNPSLTPFEIARALQPPSESPVSARPLVNLSFAVDRALHGLSPAAFHLTNLALHVACALIAFAALCQLFASLQQPELAWLRARPQLPAFCAAAAFCVHPMAAEVVLYTTQRSEALVALCYLGATWLVVRAAVSGRAGWRGVAALLIVGALGAASKEVFVSAPFVLLACDRAFFAGSFRGALRQRRALYAALACSLIPLLLLQRGAPRSESVRLFELDYMLAQLRIVPGYFLHALWPADPVLDYGMLWPAAAHSSGDWLALGLACMVVFGLAVLAWRAPRCGFVTVWALAIVAPTSSVLSIHTEIGAERRFYLPLIAVLAALVVAVCALLARAVRARPAHVQRRARVMLFGVAVCVLALLVTLTRQHTLAYRDTRTFWEAAVRARPDNARAYYNLAETLRREGDVPAAISSLRRASSLQPSYAEAHMNLSGLLIATGARAEGLLHAERAAALLPGSPGAHYNLALACAFNGQQERALQELLTTLRLAPEHWDAHRRLAQAYLSLGRPQEALEHARALLRHLPGDPVARHVLAAAQ